MIYSIPDCGCSKTHGNFSLHFPQDPQVHEGGGDGQSSPSVPFCLSWVVFDNLASEISQQEKISFCQG
jgi:hypothetical protein